MTRTKGSQDSLSEANRSRGRFSGHGGAKGIAGHVSDAAADLDGAITTTGDVAVVNPHEHGFEPIRIAMQWDNVNSKGEKRSLVKKLVAKSTGKPGVDLDLGCLYELQTGERGAIQAFGKHFGNFEQGPFITLSGDERTGDTPGDDEYLIVNGRHWPDIKRILLYVYIYAGVSDWSTVRPVIYIRVPGEDPLRVCPAVGDGKLAVCAVATLENVRNGIRLTGHAEFFAGHAEMDRAFGFGIEWEDGAKD